jgi:hypothetical protein
MPHVSSASAQSVRGSVNSLARYIEVRTMTRDTVGIGEVIFDADSIPTFEGRPVFCAATTCTFYRPGDVEHAVAAAHDVSFTTWGFGLEGLSGTVYLRSRQNIGGDFTWPRSDDAFDAILAYAELVRERYRVRLGRQRSLTGLGFYSFDGATATFSAADWIDLEAYGGRSLARALEEPRHEALAGVENFIPDNNAWLVGGAAQLQGPKGMAATLRYQREIWGDRAALVSERASLDFRSSILNLVNVEGAADYDVAYNRLGKAHITLRRAWLDNRLAVDLTGRRYLPFFELWTIWGVFSPVAYNEAEVQAGFVVNPRLNLSARAGKRRFNDTDAAVFLAPAADESWRFGVRGRYQMTEAVTFDADYQVENGFGAFLSSGEAQVGWSPSERVSVGAHVTAFQQIFEFRTGEAAVIGVGGQAAYRISDALEVHGNASLYRQAFENRPSAMDWNQKRAAIGIEWTFGRDPGVGGAQ